MTFTMVCSIMGAPIGAQASARPTVSSSACCWAPASTPEVIGRGRQLAPLTLAI